MLLAIEEETVPPRAVTCFSRSEWVWPGKVPLKATWQPSRADAVAAELAALRPRLGGMLKSKMTWSWSTRLDRDSKKAQIKKGGLFYFRGELGILWLARIRGGQTNKHKKKKERGPGERK